MEIPILVEPIANNGYQARTGEPLALTAEGTTREEAVQKLRELLATRLQNGAELRALRVADANPWVEFAGMFKDDPYFDEWQEAIAETRRKDEEDPNYL